MTLQDQFMPLSELEDLRARNKALQRKIAFLEDRLSQRQVETQKDYERLKPYFDSIKDKIMQIFLNDVPVTDGLSHGELQQRFSEKYPDVSITDLPRRVRELVNDDRLWRAEDPDGMAKFFLKLKGETKKTCKKVT